MRAVAHQLAAAASSGFGLVSDLAYSLGGICLDLSYRAGIAAVNARGVSPPRDQSARPDAPRHGLRDLEDRRVCVAIPDAGPATVFVDADDEFDAFALGREVVLPEFHERT